MAAVARNKQQREVDLVDIARWYVEGHHQGQIAELLGKVRPYNVSRRTISNDVAELHKRWRSSQVEAMGQAVFKDLERLDHLERTYWARYEAALKERKRTTTKQRRPAPRVNQDGEMVEANGSSEAAVVTEQGVGWNLALSGVMAVQQERRKVLGLYAPEKVRQWIMGAEVEDADLDEDDALDRDITGMLDRIAERERAGRVALNDPASEAPPTPLALARLVS